MILDLFKLDGKVAVVTGANTGLGQGMAIALAQAGAKLFLWEEEIAMKPRQKLTNLEDSQHRCLLIYR